MGKRSSKESKLQHSRNRQVKRILLDGAWRDTETAETVYTPDAAAEVQTQLNAEFGAQWNPAIVGEVLFAPGFESPTLNALSQPQEA